MIELTVDDYLTRLGEAIDDTTLTASADGARISRARALAQINAARRGLLREFLQAGVAESRFSERVEISADSSDTDMYALPSRMYHLIAIVDGDDSVYEPVRSRLRPRDVGYLVEPRSIRWYNIDPPGVTLYAIVVREPVSLSTGTAAAGTTSSITLASSPTTGRNILENDHYNGCRMAILSGTGALQTATVTDFVASTRVATATWSTAPSTDSVYSFMEDMPRCVVDSVVLRAAYNLTRFDAEFDHVIDRLYGEYQHAYHSALAELMKPSSTSADGPRRVEDWTV